MTAPLKLLGNPGSPYSRKLRSVLRYRHIPHQWILRSSTDDRDTPRVPVQLIPVLVFPGDDGAYGEATIDSTFQIRRLESMFAGRNVIPTQPALAFLDFLLEDFGDEWMTKAMYHYRWSYTEDADNAGAILPLWQAPGAPEQAYLPLSKAFCERQISRRGLVGINDVTAPLIEESYVKLLRAMGAHLTGRRFIMGDRPGLSDFGLFGQLSQLGSIDPTSARVAREESPRVLAYCSFVEDLSGIVVGDDDWLQQGALPETLRPLLEVVGTYYAPFLLANADALQRGADEMQCEIAGRPWTQRPFPYQGKCLQWLREAYAALSTDDRTIVDSALTDTGCETLFG